MNDSLRTDLFVRYLPEAIACACIYLASCKLGIPLPRHPTWWEMFTVDDESVHEIALCLIRLYARPRCNVSALESRLSQLRKSLVEAREHESAMRKQAQSNTPGTRSGHSSGNNSSPQNGDPKRNIDQRFLETSTDLKEDDFTRVLSSQSLLANALATAKAVAATITASKRSQLDSDLDMKISLTSDVVQEAKNIEPRNGWRGAADTSPNSDQRCTGEHASSLRPMVYPSPVVEEHQDTTQSRRRKHDPMPRARSSQHGYSDAPSADAIANAGPPTAYSLTNNSRHYRRQHTDDASSNSSGSSVSPIPKRKCNGILYDSSNKFIRDRSSSSNTSSSHSDNDTSSRQRGTTISRKYRHSNDEEHNGPLPPKAYRTENRSSRDEQSSTKLHHTSGSKSRSSRSHARRRHHRHREARDDKRNVNSHERRRR